MSKRRTTKAARKVSTPTPAAPAPAPAQGSLAVNWLVPGLIILLFLPAIFILPYYVPMPGPSNSQSWEFGFNNTTAQEFIGLMLLALFGWRLFSSRADFRQTPVAKVLFAANRSYSNRALWVTMVIFQVLTCAILIKWYNILPYTHYGEFTYFIQRIEVMVATGRMPHRDFDFDYGSGMLLVPLAIYKIFGGRLAIENAYLASLLMHFLAGYALLAYMVSRVFPRRGRAVIYLLLAIPWISLCMGLQYTPLRFTIASASIFAVHHAYESTGAYPGRRWVILTLAALFLPLCNFFFSPEMGLALTVALFAYFGWFLRGPDRWPALMILPLIAGIALNLYIFPRAYFNSMFSFGKGGASFPLFPTVHIVPFLVASICVFPQLGVIAVRDKTAAAPFCAGLAILMGLFILPAMGRCDSGHIIFNAMALFILALSAATWLKPKWSYLLLGAYGLAFPFMDIFVFWDHYKEPVEDALDARRQLSTISYTSDNYPDWNSKEPVPLVHYTKLLPLPAWAADLPNIKIGIPLGTDEAVERYLLLTGRTIQEYHIAPYYDLFGESDLDRKYADLDKMDYILIPAWYLRYLQMNPVAQMLAQGRADSKWLSGLLLFPIDLQAVHPMFQPNAEIIRHIADEYGLVKAYPDMQNPTMLLLKRKRQ